MPEFHTYSTTVSEVVATRIIDHTETHDAKSDLGQDASFPAKSTRKNRQPLGKIFILHEKLDILRRLRHQDVMHEINRISGILFVVEEKFVPPVLCITFPRILFPGYISVVSHVSHFSGIHFIYIP